MMIIFSQMLIFQIAAAIIIIMVASVFFIIFARSKKAFVEPINQAFLDQLVNALGGIDNIVQASKEHQRLKVLVQNIKLLDANSLKVLQLAAFLKGREVTLLIKNQPEKVLAYLNEQRKGV